MSPFYDYTCINCGHKSLDVFRNIKENVSILKCPICKGTMKQKIGKSIFKLKGSGWYKPTSIEKEK